MYLIHDSEQALTQAEGLEAVWKLDWDPVEHLDRVWPDAGPAGIV